ncbi:MAG: phosphate/phosphite/phosphonate ABC transporter substrate-binding protein [Pseudomonadota bacterium]
MAPATRNLQTTAFICFLLFTISLVFSLPQAAAHDPTKVIRFGVFPYKSPRTTFELFGPIAKRIEIKTGKKVVLVSAPDYKTYIERGKQGGYDLALPCATCFFKMQEAGFHVIARGEPSFYGGVIVRKDSDITTIAQLKGRKIAAIGPHSYAGYMFLKDRLDELGITEPENVTIHFLNKTDSIIYSILNKEYDAGVTRVDQLEGEQFTTVRGNLRIVDLSPPIPQFPFVVKNDMAPETAAQIKEVLLAISPNDPAGEKLLDSLRFDRIIASQDSDYEPFRKIIEMHSDVAQ